MGFRCPSFPARWQSWSSVVNLHNCLFLKSVRVSLCWSPQAPCRPLRQALTPPPLSHYRPPCLSNLLAPTSRCLCSSRCVWTHNSPFLSLPCVFGLQNCNGCFPLCTGALGRRRLFNRFSMFTQHRCSMWRKTAASTPMETCESMCWSALMSQRSTSTGANESPQAVPPSRCRPCHQHMMPRACVSLLISAQLFILLSPVTYRWQHLEGGLCLSLFK